MRSRWGLSPPCPDEPPHLTLTVLSGSYDPLAMHATLAETAASWAPFRVTSAGYGLFVGHGSERPVVVQLPLTKSPRLSALHETVVRNMAALGLGVAGQYEPEHWRPHVTLADLAAASPLVGEMTAWLVAEGPRHTTVVVDNLALVTTDGVELRAPFAGYE